MNLQHQESSFTNIQSLKSETHNKQLSINPTETPEAAVVILTVLEELNWSGSFWEGNGRVPFWAGTFLLTDYKWNWVAWNCQTASSLLFELQVNKDLPGFETKSYSLYNFQAKHFALAREGWEWNSICLSIFEWKFQPRLLLPFLCINGSRSCTKSRKHWKLPADEAASLQ